MSKQGSLTNMSRRDFLRLLGGGAVVLSFVPFVPFGNFMPNPRNENLKRAKVMLPDGTHANVKTYPVNHSDVVTYPSTGDPALDAEAFRKWNLIRLPSEMGGESQDASAFRLFSMVCLHLWCLWTYFPQNGRKRGECPCHASAYDPLTGTAIKGPASAQAPPSNILPKLDMEADSDGFLYIKPPIWGTDANGIVGYGRFHTNTSRV